MCIHMCGYVRMHTLAHQNGRYCIVAGKDTRRRVICVSCNMLHRRSTQCLSQLYIYVYMHCTQACTYTLHTSHGTCMKQSWHMYDAASLNTVSLSVSHSCIHICIYVYVQCTQVYTYTLHTSRGTYMRHVAASLNTVSLQCLSQLHIYICKYIYAHKFIHMHCTRVVGHV